MEAELPEELFLMKDCGYGVASACVMLVSIEAPWHSARSSDEWGERSQRTMTTAHKYIEKHFDELIPCAVVDVEYILGEKDKPSLSLIEEDIQKLIEQLNNLDET
jgi:hypothetical protein